MPKLKSKRVEFYYSKAYSYCYSHNERKGKYVFQHIEGCHWILNDHSGLRVQTIQRTVMPLSQTVCLESVWSLYLLLGSMGPILTMSKFFWGRGLLSSLGIKESKAPGFMKPAAPCISKEHFKAPKALWRSSTLSFLSCLSLIISWLV